MANIHNSCALPQGFDLDALKALDTVRTAPPVRHTILGEIGLGLLGAEHVVTKKAPDPLARALASVLSDERTQQESIVDGIRRAIASLRAANVPPNPDGSFSVVTASGAVVHVRSDA